MNMASAFREYEDFEKCKVLEKKFAGLKKMTYLCSPFAPQKCAFFQHGSLNYWFYLREKKCSIYLSNFLYKDNRIVRTLTIHYDSLQWRV